MKPQPTITLLELEGTTATLSVEFDLAEVLNDSYINVIKPYPVAWEQRPYPVQEQVDDMNEQEIIQLILKHIER